MDESNGAFISRREGGCRIGTKRRERKRAARSEKTVGNPARAPGGRLKQG
jgi:hypothetical protein